MLNERTYIQSHLLRPHDRKIREKKGGSLVDPENQPGKPRMVPFLIDVCADARCLRLALQALRLALSVFAQPQA